MEQHARSRALAVVTADPELLDHILSVTAALDAEPDVAPEAGLLRSAWTTARAVVVGVDQAATVAQLSLPRRAGVFLVGHDAEREPVHTWSIPLGAAVLTLPSDASRLSAALADLDRSAADQGRLLAVVGACGGVGASTLAAALALVGTRAGQPAVLVDADPLGGGLDLLLGAERLEGWRWPRLARAHGHLGDLTGHLPHTDGVDVLAMARGGGGPVVEPEAMRAVLDSVRRSHSLCVVDLPRTSGVTGAEVLRRAEVAWLIVPADVRGVAAAREVLPGLDEAYAVAAVVRSDRLRRLDPGVVADSLGLDLAGVVVDEPALARAAQSGDPPARTPRSPLARTCRQLIGRTEVAAA